MRSERWRQIQRDRLKNKRRRELDNGVAKQTDILIIGGNNVERHGETDRQGGDTVRKRLMDTDRQVDNGRELEQGIQRWSDRYARAIGQSIRNTMR